MSNILSEISAVLEPISDNYQKFRYIQLTSDIDVNPNTIGFDTSKPNVIVLAPGTKLKCNECPNNSKSFMIFIILIILLIISNVYFVMRKRK